MPHRYTAEVTFQIAAMMVDAIRDLVDDAESGRVAVELDHVAGTVKMTHPEAYWGNLEVIDALNDAKVPYDHYHSESEGSGGGYTVFVRYIDGERKETTQDESDRTSILIADAMALIKAGNTEGLIGLIKARDSERPEAINEVDWSLPAQNVRRGIKRIVAGEYLAIDAPGFFKDKDFLAWLNNGERKLTSHKPGETASEFSDLIVGVDPSLTGEGTDSDMPEHIWNAIVRICRQNFTPSGLQAMHILVWIRNID